MPTVSNLNFTPGVTVANLVTVPLSSSGMVSIFNHAGSTNVVVDVDGYYTSTPSTNGSGLYNSISPDACSWQPPVRRTGCGEHERARHRDGDPQLTASLRPRPPWWST